MVTVQFPVVSNSLVLQLTFKC